MADPFHRVVRDRFTVVFTLGGGEDPAGVSNVDAEVQMADGSRWSATFMTLDAVRGVMERWRVSGECGGGAYFRVPDLVVVREPGLAAMVAALDDALAGGYPEDLLVRLDDEDH